MAADQSIDQTPVCEQRIGGMGGDATQVEYSVSEILPQHRFDPRPFIAPEHTEYYRQAILDPVQGAQDAYAAQPKQLISQPDSTPEALLHPTTRPNALRRFVTNGRKVSTHSQNRKYGAKKYSTAKHTKKAGRHHRAAGGIGRSLRASALETAAQDIDEGLGTAVRSAQTVRSGIRSFRSVVRKTARVARTTAHAVRSTAAFAGKVAAVIAHAVGTLVSAVGSLLLSAGLPVIIVIVLVCVIVITIFPSIFGVKTSLKELSETYAYVTELDAQLTAKIRQIELHPPEQVDEIHYFLNGHETVSDGVVIRTNADALLIFLDVKYPNYLFDETFWDGGWFEGLFGTASVKEEVEQIHSRLYSYSTKVWTEDRTVTQEQTDPETGEVTPVETTQQIRRLDVNVECQSFETFLKANADTFLSPDQQDCLDAIFTVGPYTQYEVLGSPFPERKYFSVDRWGWRYHPAAGSVIKHKGVDIAMPYGTRVSNVMTGIVEEVGSSAEYGNYVRITYVNGNWSGEWRENVLYAQLATVSVAQGQTVPRGDEIGTVGFSREGVGAATALHMEYATSSKILTPLGYTTISNDALNPLFYMSGTVYSGTLGVTGMEWLCPVTYERIASPYGWRLHPIYNEYRLHNGIDLAASAGTPIIASRAGTVRTAGYNDSNGNYVVIDHADGFDTRYLHMSSYIVTAGQTVNAGDVIGYVGSTGDSTGAHLHFSIFYDGEPVDPAAYIDFAAP